MQSERSRSNATSDPLGLERLREILRMSAELTADLDRLRAEGAALEAQARRLVEDLDADGARSDARR